MLSWQQFRPKLEAEALDEPGGGGDFDLTLTEQLLLLELLEYGDLELEQGERCCCSAR